MSENPAIFYSAVIFKVVWRGNLKSLIVKMDIVSGGYTGHCYFVVAYQRNILSYSAVFFKKLVFCWNYYDGYSLYY